MEPRDVPATDEFGDGRDIGVEVLDVGLVAGLAGLAGLVSGEDSLRGLLTDVAEFAVESIPGADGAGVTMIEAGVQDTIVASSTFVTDIDAIQYRLGEGPCISAAARGNTTYSRSLGDDPHWPAFGPLAAAEGIHSAMSFPLIVSGEVIGTINAYAHAPQALGDSARRAGRRFAIPAAVAVHNARRLDQAHRAVAALQRAVVQRNAVDLACGILMSRLGLSVDECLIRLRVLSQSHNQTMVQTAEELIADSARLGPE